MSDADPGTLVLLAGPSCSGKSSLGAGLRDELGLPWLFWEIDRVAPRLPTSAIIEPDRVGHLSEAEVHQALALQDRLVEASLRAVGAYLGLGFSVIAELFLWDRRHLAIATRVLDRSPLVVELRCSVEVREQRERERGTTYLGTARAEARQEWVIPADLVLDATRSTPELVREVAEWLARKPEPAWSN